MRATVVSASPGELERPPRTITVMSDRDNSDVAREAHGLEFAESAAVA